MKTLSTYMPPVPTFCKKANHVKFIKRKFVMYQMGLRKKYQIN